MSAASPIDTPARQVMPPLTSAERAALRASIERFGVLIPILVDQHGTIIDGHNRSEIAAEVDRPCPAEVIVVRDELHAFEVAQSVNLDRRHLDEVTRKRVAQSLVTSGHSLRAAARALGVSHETVRQDLDYQVSDDLTPDIDEEEATPVDVPNGTAEPIVEPERVTGTDGKSYPRQGTKWTDEALLNLLSLYDGGLSQAVLAEMHDTTQSNVSGLLSRARDLADESRFTVDSPPRFDDMSRSAVTARRRLIAELAAGSYTSRQIAKMLGFVSERGDDGIRRIAAAEGIEIPADKAVGVTRKIDPNRIVEETVMGLEGYVFGLNLVDFAELDPDQVAAWAESLRSSISTLNRFLKKMKETTK